jgi:DNA processing protein
MVSGQPAGRAAADMGISVVSGLALGCDTQAHQGCVEGAGTGVAVLAHGPDFIYPAANRQLAAELVDLGGCLVSELPAGEKRNSSDLVR